MSARNREPRATALRARGRLEHGEARRDVLHPHHR